MRRPVRFKLYVKMPDGREVAENYERSPDEEPRRVYGYGVQPAFRGDVNAWGAEIIEWFNRGCSDARHHRVFVRAELTNDGPD